MNRSTRHAAFKPVQIVRVARFSVQSEACPVARMTNARCDKCTVLGGRIDDRLECIDEISSILHDCCLFNATAFGVVLFPNMARHLQIVIHLPGVESRIEHEERCFYKLVHVRRHETFVDGDFFGFF